MSMISELVKELREYGSQRKGEIASLTLRAADTIEMLSEKTRVVPIAEIKVDSEEIINRLKEEYDIVDRWIPCEERLPDDDEMMLVTYVDRREGAMLIWIGWHEMENVWYIDGDAHCEELGNEVIAWMPLPEPWKGAVDKDINVRSKEPQTEVQE